MIVKNRSFILPENDNSRMNQVEIQNDNVGPTIDQTVFPNPAQAGLPTPEVQSNAPHIQIRHSTPVLENSYHNNGPLPTVT